MSNNPWVSFCISTFKRPEILRTQLALLSKQSFPFFEVIISDNDPDASARSIVIELADPRFRYFNNEGNLGMIRSFNKSIERARTPYIVMVTDDDPVVIDFLENFHELFLKYPKFSIYCGFLRNRKNDVMVEAVSNKLFVSELLDPDKTFNLLWSSAVIRREDAISVGLIPDYGSPHLADHAFLALVGSVNGGIMMNKMFSSLTSHNTNFSKSNLPYYVSGCRGFYDTMIKFKNNAPTTTRKIVVKHLKVWFFANFFNLRRYYVLNKGNSKKIEELDKCAKEILSMEFMRRFKARYFAKKLIFSIKARLKLLG